MDRVVDDTTESELLEVLLEALEAANQEEREPGTITSSEFAVAIGMSRSAARRRLQQLRAAGKVKPAMITRVDDWGTRLTVKGYRLAEAE